MRTGTRSPKASEKRSSRTLKQRALLAQNRPVGSKAAAAESEGCGPNLSLEGDYFTLRWSADQAAEALDSAGMTLQVVMETHLITRLDAMKTECFQYRGEVRDKRRHPDWRARLSALKLCLSLYGATFEE
jgi:hypothetical protein